MENDVETRRHANAVAIASRISNNVVSNLTNHISSHRFGHTISIRDALKVMSGVQACMPNDCRVTIGSQDNCIVISFNVCGEPHQSGSKRKIGDIYTGSPTIGPVAVIREKFRRFVARPTPKVYDACIMSAKESAAGAQPPIQIEDKTWEETQRAVRRLGATKSVDGRIAAQQILVNVSQPNPNNSSTTQCPKVIVIARIAACVPVHLLDIQMAHNAQAQPIDGIFTTTDGVKSLKVNANSVPYHTNQRETIKNGQSPMNVVIAIGN